jgi:hypothetical protein
MISQSLRRMLLAGLMIAAVVTAGMGTDTGTSHHQPVPCGPDCSL